MKLIPLDLKAILMTSSCQRCSADPVAALPGPIRALMLPDPDALVLKNLYVDVSISPCHHGPIWLIGLSLIALMGVGLSALISLGPIPS